MKYSIIYSLTLLLAGTSALAQVAFPYTNDFSTSVADFTSSGNNSTWTLNSGVYEVATTSLSTRAQAGLTVTGIGGATPMDFSVSTTFSADKDQSNESFGFALFGDSAASPTSNYLLVDVGGDDNLRILNVGGPGNGSIVNTQDNATGFTFAANTAYDLVAQFDYTGTDLVVTLTVTDTTDSMNTGTITSPSFSTVSNLDSNVVGLTARNGTSGAPQPTMTTSFDSFTIVPEPNALPIIAGVAGLGMVILRRRK